MKSIGRMAAWVLLAFTAYVLSGCGEEHIKSRNMLEIVVSTPQGDLVGQTVYGIDVVVGKGMMVSGGVYRSRSAEGEAIALKLGNGKYLFVPLLENQAIMVDKLFSTEVEKIASKPGLSAYESMAGYERTLASMRGRRVIPLDDYPPLITFKDLNDPRSAVLLTPENFADNLGSGMQLKAMYLTQLEPDVPITKGVIQPLLPWLKSFGQTRGGFIHFKRTGNEQNRLGDIFIESSNFVTNLYK